MAGDEAWALVDGKAVRMGEGWPVEVSNSWSSPSWVVRILENEGVPYTWNFDLKAGTQAGMAKANGGMTKAEQRMRAAQASKGGYAANPYIPDSRKSKISALGSENYKTGHIHSKFFGCKENSNI